VSEPSDRIDYEKLYKKLLEKVKEIEESRARDVQALAEKLAANPQWKPVNAKSNP